MVGVEPRAVGCQGVEETEDDQTPRLFFFFFFLFESYAFV